MKCLLVTAHPLKDSLCAQLAERAAQALAAGGDHARLAMVGRLVHPAPAAAAGAEDGAARHLRARLPFPDALPLQEREAGARANEGVCEAGEAGDPAMAMIVVGSMKTRCGFQCCHTSGLGLQCVSNDERIHTMRTNIVIDDKLMNSTLRATGLKTKREAVELGLRTLLRLRQQEGIKRFRGKLNWQGDLDAMRTDK